MSAESTISWLIEHLNVSRETIEHLKLYESLIDKWNPTINLVSRASLPHIWERHILDSAQIWSFCPNNARYWLDLGSGGGFPGLVIAILAAGQRTGLTVGLVESDVRKASFLLQAVQTLGIPATIYQERSEILMPQSADVISARALAPLDRLLGFAARHLAKNGTCLLQKGKSHSSELTQAQKYWKFEVQKMPSVTDSDGVILKIGGLGRVSPQ
jgi:16S rRNA (guanine527-N7)-methyltransferase